MGEEDNKLHEKLGDYNARIGALEVAAKALKQEVVDNRKSYMRHLLWGAGVTISFLVSMLFGAWEKLGYNVGNLG